MQLKSYTEASMKINFFILSSVFFTACTTGNTYPKQHAKAFCKSAFTCMDNESIEFFYSYDSEEDCLIDQEKLLRESSGFDAFEEGDLAFNNNAANLCLTEMEEVLSDSDCDGEMDLLSFLADASSDDCSDVYE
jgi:hypothetical protein